MLKKQTIKTIIKYITLFIVLMLPLLATLPTTLYYGMNEHAIDGQYQEYSVQYQYETNEVNSVSDLVNGNIYKYSNKYIISSQEWLYPNDVFINETYLNEDYPYFIRLVNYQLSDTIKLFNIDNEQVLLYSIDILYNNEVCNIVYIDYSNVNELEDSFGLYFEGDGTTSIGISRFKPNIVSYINLEFYFILTDTTDISNLGLTFEGVSASDYLGNATLVEETTTTNASNAFERASKDVFKSSMFSWVENSPLTTNIVGMISFFGIVEGTLMNNLITYWISVIAIFMIINIVLLIFDKLTHIINKDTE